MIDFITWHGSYYLLKTNFMYMFSDQLFVFVAAEYETQKNQLNQVKPNSDPCASWVYTFWNIM